MLEHRPLSLHVFDAGGRRVRSIEHLAVAGPHTLAWDGMDEGGRRVPPGIYVVRLRIARSQCNLLSILSEAEALRLKAVLLIT